MEKNLENEQALAKYKKLADDINVCMFISSLEKDETARPMATMKIDDDGTTWFFTARSSGKVQEVTDQHIAHLLYAHPGKSSYLDVWGYADLVTDRQKIKELWSPIVRAWFPGGVDDPQLCLLRIKPYSAHYWDTEAGKMISFLKILASAATGKRLSEGVEGDLDI